ncbi:energy transducer TonB [Caldimonas sp. KR1-144]|uniref:energy transducer TonB n=1 Tax=Caldimonas sp. KR1-144 TaxID=3400911 RepID=UPI003C08108F
MKQAAFEPGKGSGRSVGIGVVAGVHVVIGWALASGLGNEMVKAIKKPLEAVVLQEVVLPPPPPPPPPPKPIEQPKQIVQQAPVPPPPFVPPAEIAAPPSDAPVVMSTPTPPAEPVPIAPPPPPAPAAPVGKVDLAIACPTQVRPEIPAKALRDGVSGTVRAQATITAGVVSAVEILGGPRVFHAAVREAMQKYRCTAPDGTVAVQVFDFKVE